MRAAPYGLDRGQHCASCKWKERRFFCDVDDETLEQFEKVGFTNVYPASSILFSEGQSPHGIFLICTGSVKLTLSAGDGRALISRIARAGEVPGLSSVLTGRPFKATAETMELSRIHFVRRDDFLRFLVNSPAVSTKAVWQLSEACEAGEEQIRALGLSHSAAEKLANLLLQWCVNDGKDVDDGIRVPLLMTHEDIAQMIGASRETVTRLLRDFRERKIVTVRGAALTVHDRAALEGMVLL